MAKKNTEKTGNRGPTKPFVERMAKKLAGLKSVAERMAKLPDDKKGCDAGAGLLAVISDAQKWLESKPADYRLPGSATSSAGNSWKPGDKATVIEEFALLFPKLKSGVAYEVKEVQKIGEGRGSKTILVLENGVAGMGFQFK